MDKKRKNLQNGICMNGMLNQTLNIFEHFLGVELRFREGGR